MAEITLRQYLKTVEQHVQGGRYEEAIAHTRHILEHFPRLAAAYRLLGLALVGLSRWDEAGEVFRRLLSATPDDFVAHQQLSQIYEKLKQPQESLWHLERALDLQPNDTQSVARLRELYSKERGAPLDRVPMTTAALAGQYINNGLTEQAVEVLQQAVGRMPERIDLKLMLARAQWQCGQHIEAGETAVEVLQTMPYTLAANRIMTELWLEVQRPADAQRFLSRVEEVDPYLALRLATGAAPTAETLQLPELDYQQQLRRTLTQQSPAWLDNLTQQEDQPLDLSAELGDDWMNEIDSTAATAPTSATRTVPPRRITDNLPNLLPEDDLSDTGQLSGLSPELIARIDAMRGMAADQTTITDLTGVPVPGQKAPIVSGMLNFDFEEQQASMQEEDVQEPDNSWLDDLTRHDDFTIEASDVNATDDDWIGNLERAAGTTGDRVPTGLTGQLGEFDADDAIDDLDAMLNSLENASPVPAGTPRSSSGLTGMLDSLGQTDVPNEIEQGAPTILRRPTSDHSPTLATDEAESKPKTKPKHPGSGSLESDTDNLAWVTEFDPDMATGNTAPLPQPVLPSSDAQDNLAWLQDSGIEVDVDAPSRPYAKSLTEDFEGEKSDVSTPHVNPNAWMDALGVDYARTDDLLDEGSPSADDEEPDSMAWARRLDLVSNAATSALPAVDLPILPPPMPSDPLDWMSDDDDDNLLAEYEDYESLAQDDEYDDTLTDEERIAQSDLTTDELEALSFEDDDAPVIPHDYRSNDLTETVHTEGQASMQSPSSWEPRDPDDPDQPSMSDDLEWLSADALTDDTLGEDAYIPDPDADEPITDLDSFFGGPLAETPAAASTQSADADLGDDSWLSDLNLESDLADETPVSDDALEPEFDWSIEPATDVSAEEAPWLTDVSASSADSRADEGFDWNSGFGDEAALTTDEPDWLADIEDPASADADLDLEADSIDDLEALPADASWLSELEEPTPSDTSTPMAWEDTDADEPELAWLTQASDNVLPDEALQDFTAQSEEEDLWAEPAGEAWLSDLELPSEDDAVAQPLSTADAGQWLNEDATGLDWETLDDAAPSPTSGMTDMLNNIETQRYGTDLLESLETSHEEPTWLETVDNLDADPVDDADAPDWMQELEAPHTPITAGIDWDANTFADEAVAAEEGEAFDWENPTFAMEQDADQLSFDDAGDDEFAFHDDAAFDPDALTEEPVLDAEQPEWLAGVAPATDDAWMEDDAALAADEPSWLSDLDSEPAAVPDGMDETADQESITDDEFAYSETDNLFGDLETDDQESVTDDEFAYSETDNLFGDLETDDNALPVAETGYFTGTGDESFDEENWLADDDFAPQPDDADAIASGMPVAPVIIEGLEVEPVGAHADAHLSDAASVREDVTDDDLREYDFEEELEATPASNAPDWLNSMVPGLDLDFEAEAEAEEVAEPTVPVSPTRRKDFEWLETIVMEEISQRIVPVAPPPPPSLPGVPAAPSLGERMRRFVFKDVPAWMRGGTSAATLAALVAAPTVDPAAAQVMADLDRDFNADMDDDLFDDSDAEFDDFDNFDDFNAIDDDTQK